MRQIFITIDVEEWFHSQWFDANSIIEKYYNGIYPPTDIVETVQELIDVFDRFNVEATFFVLGETAQRYPVLLKNIKKPHEIACHGYYHNKKYDSLKDFKEDIRKFKKEVKRDVSGFRFPNFDYSVNKLRIVREEGFEYDSSVHPCIRIPGWYGDFRAPIVPYRYDLGNGEYIREVPLSVFPYVRLPGAGGWYMRNFGYYWTKYLIKAVLSRTGVAILYFHPWEISDTNPDIKEIGYHVFRNTGDKMIERIKRLLKSFPKCKFSRLASIL
jgi:polysaccharide deacetylase family protein (PEP-CTERM system associated)